MGQHDAAWLTGDETHVREEKAGEALSRRGCGGGRAQAAAAAAAGEAWPQGRVEASVFARVLQDIEDRCLDCVRRVLQGEGWPARSWQQDGLLVEDTGERRLRSGGGKMHDDLRKSEKDSTLEHSLFVAFNTE